MYPIYFSLNTLPYFSDVLFSFDSFLLSSVIPIKIYSNLKDYNNYSIVSTNKNKSGIYRWVNNLDNCSYIGSSSNLANRFNLYFSKSYLSNQNKKYSLIQQALLEHGYSNFTLQILEYCSPSIKLQREQYYIDSCHPEYNIIRATSDSGFKHSNESIAKRVATLKANNLKDSLSNPKVNVDKMRLANPRSKLVFQYQADKITFVAKYLSLRQAQEATGLTRDYISKCIKEDKLTHNNYWFSFVEISPNS